MYIKELIFANKHYHNQEECIASLETVKALPVQGLHMDYNGPENKPSAWWAYSKISISFKAEFDSMEEMFSVCQELKPEEPVKKDTYGWLMPQSQPGIEHKIYGEIVRILEARA